MKSKVLKMAAESAGLTTRFFQDHAGEVVRAAELAAECLASGGKILIFGNGGSAADAQHIAAEFVNRFALERSPLAAVALTTDSSVLTSIANDYSYQEIFSKQVHALGRRGDLAWGISTSGTSANVLAGLDAARDMGLLTLFSAGRGGRAQAGQCGAAFCVDSAETARIQEVHMVLAHIICGLVEEILFPLAREDA